MTNPYDAEYDRLLSQYQQQFSQVVETQRQLREISCTATAPRRVVAVTVGHGGTVTDLTFPTSAYKRMAPAELAKVVLETITEAREQALTEATTIIAPTVPDGIDARALMSGSVDLQSMLPKTPGMSDQSRQIISRLSEVPDGGA